MVWMLLLIALSVLLVTVVLVWPKSARSFTPTIYTAVPQIDFERFPSSSFVSLDRPQRRETAPHASTAPKAVPTAVPRSSVRLRASLPPPTDHRLTGVATEYCVPEYGDYHTSRCMAYHPVGGPYAAAGPALRAAIGGGDHCVPGRGCWRDAVVRVCNGTRCAYATLADWCLCGGWHVIDLYGTLMKQIDPGYPGNGGVAEAVITW